jgi:hypothetical protein
MSSDLLKRAAKVLQEHAEKATPGPWEHVDYQGSENPDVTFMGCGSVITMGEDVEGGNIAAPNGDLYPRSGYSPFGDMAYIALMHPPVGLALAAILSEVGESLEQDGDVIQDSVTDSAVKLAREILREES